ncbi:GNAT family N-acetyltransferase [Actinoalloteichus caeruleus]|uniref:Acetyltransferase (GNAT) family protein n=1 Tax=Actinoalloteichus caeruleus DSM 43889 TaxID=1120930 RepID=A0ABT1JII1_ACTCY|nr:GNAT family N-acetyltransferase [Actinoalloteichus caeruleus]MCP2332087.1 Acetyltransferase (GNAT) family protein [Actinoalloteichus caeruleus DSM 43889]
MMRSMVHSGLPVIRRPLATELAEVGELTVAAYDEERFLVGNEEYAEELRDTGRRDREAELLVAVVDGRVFGTVTVAAAGTPFAEMARDGELEFRMLAVRPEARGRGVGAALTRAVLARAGELGVERVVCCSQERMTTAHRVYERLGFRRLPARDWSVDGIRLLSFEHPLGGGN